MAQPDPPALPPTDPLYAGDAYVRRFDAVVLAADPAAGTVALDRTAFFPGGGGQPYDLGTLVRAADDGPPATWRVLAVGREAGVVWHRVEPTDGGPALPAAGDRLDGDLDWARRYRLMRTHTGLHVLCGVVFRLYGALVTGGNMGTDKARLDFELDDLSPERVAAIGRGVAEEIAAGREVRVRVLPREEAFAIPDLIRTKVNLLPPGIAEVRTVEIVGLDLQADGGTHVANTREVGGLEIVGTRSKGKANKRLEVALTGTADGGRRTADGGRRTADGGRRTAERESAEC